MIKYIKRRHRAFKRWLKLQLGFGDMLPDYKPYGHVMHERMAVEGDPVRHVTHALAINTIQQENIPGAFAEAGVYRGDASAIIHALAPERKYYLFDTFEGFPVESGGADDARFRDTSIEQVKERIGNLQNVLFRKGFFPATAAGLEGERFSFVLLDMDKYEPTLAGLEFFYPRLSRGGFLFIHDFTSPESDWGCSRAVNDFLADKPERPVPIADQRGSAVFRKLS